MKTPLRFTNNNISGYHEWTQSFAKDYLEKIDHKAAINQAEKLSPLLNEWDDNGDNIILDFYVKNGLNAGQQSLKNYLNKVTIPTNEELSWQTYFSKITLEPSWLDKEKLDIGSELCRRTGISSYIVLRDYCLVGSFLTPQLYTPLFYNGDLKKNITKQISDNIEFWFQITRKTGLELGQEGLSQIFLKRMHHSYQRIKILNETDYTSQKSGIPFNIWDQLATNLIFSLLYLVGLRQIGIKVSTEENSALFHFWKYIGYLLGIPLELLPDTEEEAVHALYLWVFTQPYPDENSAILANILVNEPLHFPYPKDQFSKKIMREIHLFYNHYFLKEKNCQQLNLPKTTIGKFALAHIWQTKRAEKEIKDEANQLKSIEVGTKEQENIRNIYREYYN